MSSSNPAPDELNSKLETTAVVGAGGKMGRGIVFLLARELARRVAEGADSRRPRLRAIDVHSGALEGLMAYLELQARREARREAAKSGRSVDESEAAARLLSVVSPATDLDAAQDARLVFEAVIEKEDLKIEVLSRLRRVSSPATWFLSNTSSIPIHVLDERAGLDGRIAGFHFYNPPPVQRLVEWIVHYGTRPELVNVVNELGQLLRKKLVPSRDVAGFIGNGHFLREGRFAFVCAERLASSFTRAESLVVVDLVTRDGLLRPMGIFQLLDYVGLDVFDAIGGVMRRYLEGEAFGHPILEELLAAGLRGGQEADGTQRAGIFRYQRGAPEAVFSLERGEYVPLSPSGARLEAEIGPLVTSAGGWRDLKTSDERERQIREHFATLGAAGSLGARLAEEFLEHSRRVGERLVEDGVALCPDDVNTVLVEGFHHLYGPLSDLPTGRPGEFRGPE